MVPEWTWVEMSDRRTRWVQVFARLRPGYTVDSAKAPMQGLFHQIREYETTLPAAAKWSPIAGTSGGSARRSTTTLYVVRAPE